MSWMKEDMLEVTRNLKLSGTVEGDAKHTLTMFYSHPTVIDSSGWVTTNSNGATTLAESAANKHVKFAIGGLKEGDIITKYRLLGGTTIGTATNTCAIVSGLYNVTKSAGAALVATSVGNTTTLTAASTTAIDLEADVTDTTVADDYQYFVLVKGTTMAGASAAITGVEVDIDRIV